VARIPLGEIANSQTIHIGFTTPSDSAVAYLGHLTQNVTDTGYWAGHVTNGTLRIFSMREGEDLYSWRDVDIKSWCNGDQSSSTPGSIRRDAVVPRTIVAVRSAPILTEAKPM
jgi:hypothetical protein